MASTSTILNNVFNSMQNVLQGGVLPRKKTTSALHNVKKNIYAVRKKTVKLPNKPKSPAKLYHSPSDDLFVAMNRMSIHNVAKSSEAKSSRKSKSSRNVKSSSNAKKSASNRHKQPSPPRAVEPDMLADMFNNMSFNRVRRTPRAKMAVDPSRRSSRTTRKPERLTF